MTLTAATYGRGDSLTDGAAGIALLHIERSLTADGDAADAHEWITAICRDPVIANPRAASLFDGVPAVAFTLHAASSRRYESTLSKLDRAIEQLTRQRLATANARIASGRPAEFSEWDLISGLTGITAQQLQRNPHSQLAKDLLRYLIRLSQPLRVGREHRPAWWCPTGPDAQMSPDWPGGHANLGMAHGIAGPLAVMSIASLEGVTVDGQHDAIQAIAGWFDRWRCGTGATVWWPGLISLTEWRDGIVWQHGPQRPSWCYGTPGIARALQLTALAVGDRAAQVAAEAALAGCATDIEQLRLLTDTSLCHGWAGLTHTVMRAQADATLDSPLAMAAAELARRFRGRAATPPPRLGFLEGQAGVQLVQHSIDAGLPRSGWDRCLLLA